MIYIGTIAIIVSAIAIRKLMYSEKAIIGNGWGIYDGEYVEGRYDI